MAIACFLSSSGFAVNYDAVNYDSCNTPFCISFPFCILKSLQQTNDKLFTTRKKQIRSNTTYLRTHAHAKTNKISMYEQMFIPASKWYTERIAGCRDRYTSGKKIRLTALLFVHYVSDSLVSD